MTARQAVEPGPSGLLLLTTEPTMHTLTSSPTFLSDDFLLQTDTARRLYHDYAKSVNIGRVNDVSEQVVCIAPLKT